MQVDWITAIFDPSDLLLSAPAARVYDTGTVVSIDSDGQIVRRRPGYVSAEGSHDNKIIVSSSDGQHLAISGNPCKFLQGHNLFGSTDHLGYLLRTGLRVRQDVGLFPGPQTAESLFLPPRFTRIDFTRSYRFPTIQDAREWIRDVAGSARSRHGAPITKSGSVRFGKGSTRWSFLVYSKADEIASPKKGHALAASLGEKAISQLTEWAQGVIRLELTLRTPELVKLPHGWQILDVFNEYFGRVTWNRNADLLEGLDMIDNAKLTPVQLGYVARWRLGEDLRRHLSKPTFYRVRSGILAAVGIDILSAPPEREKAPLGASPRVSAILDPSGWDPEPLSAYLVEPDPDGALKRSYSLF